MNKKKTFQEVSKIWCDAKRPIVKHSTLCAYLLTLQTHLLPQFGAMETITECDVQQFVINKCAEGLAKKTVRDMVAVLKSVVKYGQPADLSGDIIRFEPALVFIGIEFTAVFHRLACHQTGGLFFGEANGKALLLHTEHGTEQREPIGCFD